MDNRFATTLVIAGSGVMAVSILAGAFLVGRLLLSLPVVNNSTDDYYIWLFLLSIALTVLGLVFGWRLVKMGVARAADRT
jgi:hypothetical protein